MAEQKQQWDEKGRLARAQSIGSKMLGTYNETLGEDLRNRDALQSVSNTYKVSLQTLPKVLMATLEKLRASNEMMGTTTLPLDTDQLHAAIVNSAFPGKPQAAKTFMNPTLIHDDKNPYGDGLGRLNMEVTGVALYKTLMETARNLIHHESKSEDARKFGDAIKIVADRVRQSLAYTKPVPNTFRTSDMANNYLNHTMYESLLSYDPNAIGPNNSGIPQSLSREMALARYAGDLEKYQQDKGTYLKAGYQVDPSFEAQIANSVHEDPLTLRWMDYFYGDRMPPSDTRYYGLDKETRPSVRQEVYGALDGLGVGAYQEKEIPASLETYNRIQEQKIQEQYLKDKQQAEQLQQKFQLPPPSDPNAQNGAANGQG